MIPAQTLIAKALTQKGDPYIFGAEVDLRNPNPPAFDCSELVQWAAAQCGISPTVPDGAFYQYMQCKNLGNLTTVKQGIETPGALLFMGDGTGVGRDAITHVAFSLGNGYTIEARGSRWGVGVWTATRGFDYAGLIKGVDYEGSAGEPPAEAQVRTVLKQGDRGPDVQFAQTMFQILLKDPSIRGRYVDARVADNFKADGVWGAQTAAVNERIEDFWNSEGPGRTRPLQQDGVWTMAGTAPAVSAMVTMSLAKKA